MFSGETCKPDVRTLPRGLLDSFEAGVSGTRWSHVTGLGEGSGCGVLRPEAYGRNLYFSGCGVRQAVTNELNLASIGCVELFAVSSLSCMNHGVCSALNA